MQQHRSWFFYLCALEGAAAIAALFLIPTEGARISLARLALIGFIFMIGIAWLIVGLRPPSGWEKLARPRYILLSAMLSLVFGAFLFLLRYLHPESSLSTYQRLSPLLWYLSVLSLQLFFLLLILYKGFHPASLSAQKPVYIAALSALGLLLLLLLFIALTRLGVTPDPAYWGEPGVPVLGWQFALALFGGACVFALALTFNLRSMDFFLAFGIYALAVIIWLSVPLEVLSNSF